MNSYKDDFLLHDGAKGMHWGVRKYRNYDGTLTPAGRERYGVGPPREPKKLSWSEKRALKKVKKKTTIRAERKKVQEERKKAEEAAEKLKKEREALEEVRKKMTEKQELQERIDYQRLSNDELQKRIDRIKLERQYEDLVNPKAPPKPNVPKKSLMQKASELSKGSRDIIALAKDIASIAGEIKKAKNGEPVDPNKALRVKAETDKLKYEMETRERSRKKWEEEDKEEKKDKKKD